MRFVRVSFERPRFVASFGTAPLGLDDRASEQVFLSPICGFLWYDSALSSLDECAPLSRFSLP